MSERGQVVLTMPFVYPSLNRMLYCNPFKLRADQEAYQDKAAIYLKMQSPPTFAGPVRIAVDLHFKTAHKVRRDVDNYSPKWLLDTIVKLGIIEDDCSDIIPEPPKIAFVDMAQEERTDLKIETL